MYTIRAIQFKYKYVQHDLKLSYHTDGERLPAAPNTTKTISRSVSNSLICGKLRNNNQSIQNEGHINQHQKRDLSQSPGAKESH
jgi:hypothetical protein